MAAGVAIVMARGAAPKEDGKGAGGTQPLMHATSDTVAHPDTSVSTKTIRRRPRTRR